METGESSSEKTELAMTGEAMVSLHPNQVWVLRIRAAIFAAFVLIAATIFDGWASYGIGPLAWTGLPPGLIPAAVALLAIAGIIIIPPRRYRAWGYREDEDELHIRSGLWLRVRTVVPFGRVQHIDIAHGPIERGFGLATLILHTAGTRGAAVPLPGLAQEEAEQMRDRIRAKIRQELL